MAKLNQLIRAFEPDELQMLSDVLDHEEMRAEKAGIKLPLEFQELREMIHRATRYVVGFNKKTNES